MPESFATFLPYSVSRTGLEPVITLGGSLSFGITNFSWHTGTSLGASRTIPKAEQMQELEDLADSTKQPTLTGSPTRLNDDSWGVRVVGEATVGAAVQVRTRSGKTWLAEIEAVLWTGEDRTTGDKIALCRTVRDRKPSSDTQPPANPLIDAGSEVARLAREFAGNEDDRNRTRLLDAIRDLCTRLGVSIDFHPAGGSRPTHDSRLDEPPPLSDDDIPF